jgi:cellulose synthase/poly-beta-1,6-N-acetylglucosamine synthase-like glycosyltransferase
VIAHAENPSCHIITGHPVPYSSSSSIWERIATENCIIWDLIRKKLSKINSSWPLSGYLFSIRRNSVPETIPYDCVVEDAYIGLKALQNSLHLGYAANAFVYVQFPRNIQDYYRQKSRTRSGWYQISLLAPNEFKKLRKLQQHIISSRISEGSLLTILCWFLDRAIMALDRIFSRNHKDRHLWKAAPSTKYLRKSTRGDNVK